VIRRSSSFNTGRIDHIYRDPHLPDVRLKLHYGDLADAGSLRKIVGQVQPDEIYNLAAQSHVKVSFEQPEYTAEVTALGALHMLEAARTLGPGVRYYQAGSSEMYGEAVEIPQSERTPFRPRSPYACAKVFAHYQTINYRQAYGLFACNGILFNHESCRRGETFVTRKITRAATRIKLRLQDRLYLGNLSAKRDWGYAPDYMRAIWLMLQQDQPGDYVIATGEIHSVQEFVERVFAVLDLDWREYVVIDPHYFRPTEVDSLVGDASKARAELGWEPTVSFGEIIETMVRHDLHLARQEQAAAAVVPV
jgi:GDPmannose 4,6-dehydratase